MFLNQGKNMTQLTPKTWFKVRSKERNLFAFIDANLDSLESVLVSVARKNQFNCDKLRRTWDSDSTTTLWNQFSNCKRKALRLFQVNGFIV